MAPDTPLGTSAKVEVGVVPPGTPEQFAVVRRESEAFLAFIALKNTNAVLRDPDLLEDAFRAVSVSDAFIANVRRATEGYRTEERAALVQRLSGIVLEGVPLGYAELFTTRMQAFLNEQPLASEKEPPITTEQLEVMTAVVTDEAVSPPRGVAIARIQAAMRQVGARLMHITH